MAKKIQVVSADSQPPVELGTKRPVSRSSRKTVPSGPKEGTQSAVDPQRSAGAVAKPKRAATRQKSTSQNELKIFQIYYQRQQVPLLDPEFEPYNNIGDKSPLLEFNVFCKLHQDPALQTVGMWGALSWKFGQKTGLTGADLKKIIADNPGYDVYYCNPHPDTEALYHNLWVQGEACHPNFLALCREFFRCAGLPVESLIELQPTSLYSSANFFIGNRAFWDQYLAFISGVLAKADKALSPSAKAVLYSSAADKRGVHADASYLPFIVERLFSIFLQTYGGKIKAYKMPLPAVDGELNVHLQMLRQMKDLAHSQHSALMAACWANYRTLYIQTMYGKEWVRKYLKAVTPTTIRFAPLPTMSGAAGFPK